MFGNRLQALNHKMMVTVTATTITTVIIVIIIVIPATRIMKRK